MGLLEEIALFFPFFKTKKKKLKYCRDLWKGDIEKKRNFNQISILHNYKKEEGRSDIVDDSTWKDLDMESVFSGLDQTSSSIGQQVLYDQLRTYRNKDFQEKQKFHSELQTLSEDIRNREKLQLLLLKLNNDNVYSLPNLLFEELPQKPKYFIFFKISAFLSFILTIMSFINSLFIPPLFIMIGINVLSYFLFNRNIAENLPSIQALFSLLNLSIKMGNIEVDEEMSSLNILKENKFFIEKMTKGLDILLIDPANSDELTAILFFYLNFAYQISLFIFFNLKKRIEENREKILTIIEAVGKIDAQISIASFLNRSKPYCIPKFNNSNIIEFDSVYHPLLVNPVPNSIQIKDKSILITGSNMAGKTTFIKVIGINIILSQTLLFCLAKTADIPKLIIKSMFKREDNLMESKSYYFTEVEKIGKFLSLCKSRKDVLFLIDEVFKGTNTVERISASKAVLEYLSKYNYTFATTHDVELQELLKDKYLMYNFSEIIINDQYTFDYLIKKGLCKSRNAIKLLEISNYPKKVIEIALETVKKIDKIEV